MNSFLLLIHILGVVIGLGAAFASDMLFFHFLSDKKVVKHEQKILELMSKMVWAGFTVFTLSGLALMAQDLPKYLGRPIFLLKLSLVFIIFLNGIFLNHYITPKIKSFTLKKRDKKSSILLTNLAIISGWLSILTWVYTLGLAITKGYKQPVIFLVAVYLILFAGGAIVALHLKPLYRKLH